MVSIRMNGKKITGILIMLILILFLFFMIEKIKRQNILYSIYASQQKDSLMILNSLKNYSTMKGIFENINLRLRNQNIDKLKMVL